MPYVTISTVKGILDTEQKQLLLHRLTDLMVEIEGRGNPEFRKMVWVKIEEQEPSHWGLAGTVFTADQIAGFHGPIGADGRRAPQSKP